MLQDQKETVEMLVDLGTMVNQEVLELLVLLALVSRENEDQQVQLVLQAWA